MNDPAALIHSFIQAAVALNASDIHIEPQASHCRVRFRVNGLLIEKTTLPTWLGERLMTHIKLITQLNIAEKRLPQDGHFHDPTVNLDIRVSTCPQTNGEKIVLRLLKSTLFQLAECGCLPEQYHLLKQALAEPQGLILMAGPTGSGKTTTLYAALSHLNDITKNIITAEDPVEMEIPGITQVNIQPKIGYGFAQALRSFLRQDPDIIFIGEIRDSETAHIALQAAETGHLVLASIHTRDTASTFQRLTSLGINKQRLKNTISLIVSQRLLRKCCQTCFARKRACPHCIQGYQSRLAIFECYQPKFAHKSNITLKQAAHILLQQGLTTQHEIDRVLGVLSV